MLVCVVIFVVLVTITEGSDENTEVLETPQQPRLDGQFYFCGNAYSNVNGTSNWIICPAGHDRLSMLWVTVMLLSFIVGITLGRCCYCGRLCGIGEEAQKNLHRSRSLIKVVGILLLGFSFHLFLFIIHLNVDWVDYVGV